MVEQNKYFSYLFFAEPLKEKYEIEDYDKGDFKLTIDNVEILIFLDRDEKIEAVAINVDKPQKDSDFISRYFISYVQSVLRIIYSADFRISRFQCKIEKTYEEGGNPPKTKKINVDWIKKQEEMRKIRFHEKHFIETFRLFSEKPIQLRFYTDSLDINSSPIVRYINLYKIIEFEYHLSESREKARKVLLKSPFKDLVGNFEYNDRKGEELIDYIVDLRDKCSHFRKKSNTYSYGFSDTNIEHSRELMHFIPTMQKICRKVINLSVELLEN